MIIILPFNLLQAFIKFPKIFCIYLQHSIIINAFYFSFTFLVFFFVEIFPLRKKFSLTIVVIACNKLLQQQQQLHITLYLFLFTFLTKRTTN